MIRDVAATLLLAPAALLMLSACDDGGANAEDQRRLDRLVEEPIVEAEVDGVEAARPPSTQLAESESAVLGGADVANVVALSDRFVEPPDDEMLRSTARAYAAILTDAGWTSVSARCIPTNEGPTFVAVTAERDDHGYRESARVELNPRGSPRWTIDIWLSAPRHDATGSATDRSDGSLACIENATAS